MAADAVDAFGGVTRILGLSGATQRLREEVARAAPYQSSALITGPSGTGKELVARELHALGGRSQGPFIPVDCASMSGELMASQLFGHTKGAFTGANCAALGCFRAAQGGVIFLDEIGELEVPLQAKLLRVIQERAVTPVGSYQCERIDVRIVAATNRDLHEEVLAGRFREDLYYRLNVVHLRTTALADRRTDIPVLAEAFLAQLAEEGLPRCALSPDAVTALTNAPWPGNVRQLRNVLEQAAIVSESAVIGAETIRLLLAGSGGAERTALAPLLDDNFAVDAPPAEAEQSEQDGVVPSWPTLASLEREHLLRTLTHTYYNRSAAARMLGVSRQALLRKMKQYGIAPPV
jgi:DNA-binding NtrC family response regulator